MRGFQAAIPLILQLVIALEPTKVTTAFSSKNGPPSPTANKESVWQRARGRRRRYRPPAPLPPLGPSQQKVLDLIQSGKNVFLTGVAGTGKSLVLHAALMHCSKHYAADEWIALGPTGPAAIALQGQTIHSFAGIGVPKLAIDFDKTLSKKEQWKKLKILVLDEASMISGECFDLLSERVSRIRDDPRPFGGIQLVMSGDFLQLTPIPPRARDLEVLRDAHPDDDLFENRGFLFQSLAWREGNFHVVELSQVYRQTQDTFINVLNEIRTGQLSNNGYEFLRTNCERPLPSNSHGIRPTLLHSRNIDVSKENNRELQALPGSKMEYRALDTVMVDPRNPERARTAKVLQNHPFYKQCLAEPLLELKVGAQVMLLQNRPDHGLVNGSRGTVVDFEVVAEEKAPGVLGEALPGIVVYPVVEFLNGKRKIIRAHSFQSEVAGMGTCVRKAIPLRLSWAITTHKSQGLTLDYVVADLKGVFAPAQVYVALSRASSQEGLELRNFNPRQIKVNRVARQFYENPSYNFELWDGSRPMTSVPRSSTADSTSQASSLKNVSLKDKSFVIVGALRRMSRNKAQELIEQTGGVLRKAVSGKTDYLILGRILKSGQLATSSAAFLKAKELNDSGRTITILKENDFVQLISQAEGGF